MNTPDRPDDSTAWESAMSRDFDARVRDLHEAPLDLQHVKGKARSIRRHRRAAAAGGVLAVAAVVTPVAVIATGGTDDARQPSVVDTPTEVTDSAAPGGGPEYLHDGVWHRADGSEVSLPAEDYTAAVAWDDRLVATRPQGRFYAADVIDPDGEVVDTVETTSPVAVNEAGTTIAWVDTDGRVMTGWAGGEGSIGDVGTLGEGAPAYSVAAVVGGPDCHEPPEGEGCMVYVNSGTGEPTAYSSHGIVENPAPGAVSYQDATGSSALVVDEVRDDTSTCGGLYDLAALEYAWRTCDHQLQQIAPDGAHVVGLPSQYDGLGPGSIAVLDAATGDQLGLWSGDGATVATWGWADESHLLFSVHDGADWSLVSMEPDGAFEFVVEDAKGPDFRSPFVVVGR